MTHRTPPRVPITRAARSAGTAALLLAAVSAGCDSKGSTAANPQTAPAAAGGGGTGGVAVLDPRRVGEAVQWDAEQKRDAELAATDIKRELDAFQQQLDALITEKRKSLIAAGKLSGPQIDKLNAGDLEALPLSAEQKNEFRGIVQNAIQYQQQSRQAAQNVLAQRQQAVDKMYAEAVKPAVRRAAQAAGLPVVVLKQTVFYNEAGVEITDRVIDELQKAMPARTFPPIPKLNLPQVRLDEPPRPGTLPATGPAAPAPGTRSSG